LKNRFPVGCKSGLVATVVRKLFIAVIVGLVRADMNGPFAHVNLAKGAKGTYTTATAFADSIII